MRMGVAAAEAAGQVSQRRNQGEDTETRRVRGGWQAVRSLTQCAKRQYRKLHGESVGKTRMSGWRWDEPRGILIY
jgi:hypothetical protein